MDKRYLAILLFQNRGITKISPKPTHCILRFRTDNRPTG